MAEQPELPDRIRRDLEEALREGGIEKLPNRPGRRRRPSFRLEFPDLRPSGPSQLVLIGVGLCLIGYLFHPPYSPQFILVGVLCVVVAVVSHLIQPQGYQQKYWRGRWLDVPQGTWPERLYRIIYRGPRR
jgi:hypothetical protein